MLYSKDFIDFEASNQLNWLLGTGYLHPTYPTYKMGEGRPILNTKQAIKSWFDPQSVIKIPFEDVALALVNLELNFVYF